MTIAVTFKFVNSDLGGRSAKGFSYASGLLFPCWDRYTTWLMPFASGIPATINLGPPLSSNPFYESATGKGFIDNALDTSGGVYSLTLDPYKLYYRSSGGTLTSGALTLPSTDIPLKIQTDTTGLLILGVSGTVYHVTSVTSVPTTIGTFGAFTSNFSFYNGNIYGTIASTQHLGIMTNPGGSVTTVTTPMLFPAIVNATSFGIAVAGYGNTTLNYNYLSIQSSPINPSTVAAGILASRNAIQVITGNDPTWAEVSSTTTSAAPVAFAWVPNGEQVLVSETTKVEVFTLSGTTLSSSQILTVANAAALSITPDSGIALVCEGATNDVAVLVNTLGTWAIGTPLAITAPTSVACTGSFSAVVAGSAGISFLTRLGSIWSVASTTTLTGFTATALAWDSVTGNTYCIGTASGTGYFAYVDSTGVAHSVTSWTGSADEILVSSNRVIILDKTSDLFRVFSSGPTVFANSGYSESATFIAAATGFSITNNTVWVLNASEAVATQFVAGPLKLGIVRQGMTSVYNGSAWSSYTPPITEDLPIALAWSTAGNLFVASSKNNFLQLTASAALTVTTALGEYTMQAAGVPLGISSLVQNGTTWYCVTSLSGVVVVISGVTG
jgi:hypothetical protein